MTLRMRVLSALVLVLAAASSWGQQKPASSPSDVPAHIQAASTFLMAWGKGDWEAAKSVAADTVMVKIGDQEFALDLRGGKAPVTLVFPFKGITAVRVEGKVKGVTVDEIGLKASGAEKRGKGTLTLEEKEGQFRVTGVAVE